MAVQVELNVRYMEACSGRRVGASPRRSAVSVKRVRVSPDGELVKIPWHQADIRSGSDHIEIAEVDSPRALIHARFRSGGDGEPNGVLVVGNLDFDAGRTKETPGAMGRPFPRLRWAEKESREVAAITRKQGLDAVWLAGSEASKQAVFSRLRDASYVHFATHGFANGEAEVGLKGRSWEVGVTSRVVREPLLDSGLALSGANVRDRTSLETAGVLTAEELLDADLSRTKLVVLSACRTGLGLSTPAQGVMGLRSALSAAGASKMLLSLWSVDDEATSLLMTSFYRALWEDKLPLWQALRSAQYKVRAIARFRAPRFWAGWVIVDAE